MGKVEKIVTAAPKEFMARLHNLKLASEAPPEIRERLQVRKSDDSRGIGELEASVRHVGIIYPLIVDSNYGALYVTAGNRRLKVLRKIHGDQDPDIRCVDTKDFSADEREIAMAVNITLPPHPVDRFEVLSAQVKAGLSQAEVAERNALSPVQVTRVLKLADLAPEIREAWRSGKIDADVAKAYTLSSDIDEQLKFFQKLTKEGRHHEHVVRERFIGKSRGQGSIAAFVGLDAYEAAGGVVIRDMFKTDHRVDDAKLLQKLYVAKLKAICDGLIAEGWMFAVHPSDLGQERYYYSSIEAERARPTKEETARMEHIANLIGNAEGEDERELSEEETILHNEYVAIESTIKLRTFTPDIRAKSGCFVEVDRDGLLKIEYGRVKPEDRSKVAAQERAKARKKAGGGGEDEKKSAPKDVTRVSNALIERLAAQLTAAAKLVIVQEPHIALAAIIAGCASHDDTCNIRKGEGYSSKARPAFAGVFANQLKATTAQQGMTLAQIAADALSFHTYNADAPPLADKGVAALCNALPAKHLLSEIIGQFDAKDYFNSVSGPMIKRAILEAGFSEDQSKSAQKSKAELVKFAIANVPKTGWLPAQLRIAAYVGPKAATPAKPASSKPAATPAKKKAKKK